MEIVVSRLSHTWLIDIDGTIIKHNSHKNGGDELIPGTKEFWEAIPKDDVIILLTARKESERLSTIETLNRECLRFDHIIFGLPTGERILINDSKPTGLKTAIAINPSRDIGLSQTTLTISKDL